MSAIAIEAQEKLRHLGGSQRLKTAIPSIRARLSKVRGRYWRSAQAAGRIKRFLYGEQVPTHDEIEDIRAAYARFCPEKLKLNRAENAELVRHIMEFAERARQVDEEFYGAHLEAIRISLIRAGCDETEVGKFT